MSASDLVVEHPVAGGRVLHAVSGVSLDIARGETLGLVGESGCGKSTTGRALVCLPPPTRGSVVFEGTELTTQGTRARRQMRTRMQVIFQDPISSLNPGRRIADVIAEPLAIWERTQDRNARRERVEALMEAVGIDPATFSQRRAHELSGGQCQRVSIARALVLEPAFLVCDEPVSALDVSVQAQILNLLEELKVRYGLTLLFISHDLSVIRHVSDRICVMYLGKLCEVGGRDAVYETPRHPYTAALVAAVPHPDPAAIATRLAIGGELPSAIDPPSGCRFHTRCPRATAVCTEVEPPLAEIEGTGEGHLVACHHPLAAGERLGVGGG